MNKINTRKNIIAVLLCVLILVVYVMPVSAAVDATCTHTSGYRIVKNHMGYTARDNDTHTSQYITEYYCVNCNLIVKSFVSYETVDHSFTKEYVSLGHVGNTNLHRYGNKCVCGQEKDVHNVACLLSECPG